jgi:hypothetical protein
MNMFANATGSRRESAKVTGSLKFKLRGSGGGLSHVSLLFRVEDAEIFSKVQVKFSF